MSIGQDVNLEDTKTIYSKNYFGSDNPLFVSVQIKSKQWDKLDDDTKRDIGYDADFFLSNLRNRVITEYKKQYEYSKRQEHAERFVELVEKAGFDVLYSKLVENEYSGDVIHERPWVIVYTNKGPIKVGWRNSVIELNWSESIIDVDAENLFSKENVTKRYQFIHCWGEDKLVEYLTKLDTVLVDYYFDHLDKEK